jgi:hypothetical protein
MILTPNQAPPPPKTRRGLKRERERGEGELYIFNSLVFACVNKQKKKKKAIVLRKVIESHDE